MIQLDSCMKNPNILGYPAEPIAEELMNPNIPSTWHTEHLG